ncbi:MAG: YIP1 family protein [Candidatus Aenigmarchaeota archaeon]|nr:YIP1 family protein [Candidatus Aenigmarchaeota archaeon]
MALSKGKVPMSFVEKIKEVLLSPTAFFTAIKREQGIKEALVYVSILSLVSIILNYAINPKVFSELAALGLPSSIGIGIIALIWVLGILLNFLVVGFFHIFVMLLGGKEGYGATYRAFAYAATPTNLFGWIPLIGILFSLWSLYLNVKGLSILQHMSTGRALAAIVIPIAIILILIFTFAFAILAAILYGAARQ